MVEYFPRIHTQKHITRCEMSLSPFNKYFNDLRRDVVIN